MSIVPRYRRLQDWRYPPTRIRQVGHSHDFVPTVDESVRQLCEEVAKLDTDGEVTIWVRTKVEDPTPRELQRDWLISFPGAAVEFTCRYGSLYLATDRSTCWHYNLNAIAMTLYMLHRMDRYGVARGAQYAAFTKPQAVVLTGDELDIAEHPFTDAHTALEWLTQLTRSPEHTPVDKLVKTAKVLSDPRVSGNFAAQRAVEVAAELLADAHLLTSPPASCQTPGQHP